MESCEMPSGKPGLLDPRKLKEDQHRANPPRLWQDSPLVRRRSLRLERNTPGVRYLRSALSADGGREIELPTTLSRIGPRRTYQSCHRVMHLRFEDW